MPNSDLQGKIYNVPEHLKKFLGSTISYENLKMNKTRLNRAKKENQNDFAKKGGEEALKWVEETLKQDRNVIHNAKEVGMKAGRENQFKKEHNKDRENANPTGLGGIPKLAKGNVSRKLMQNKEVYNESINTEISQIKYLIEYMNNNKKTI
jgi:hypothetical protein